MELYVMTNCAKEVLMVGSKDEIIDVLLNKFTVTNIMDLDDIVASGPAECQYCIGNKLPHLEDYEYFISEGSMNPIHINMYESKPSDELITQLVLNTIFYLPVDAIPKAEAALKDRKDNERKRRMEEHKIAIQQAIEAALSDGFSVSIEDSEKCISTVLAEDPRFKVYM